MATWQTELQSVKQSIMNTIGNGRRAIDDLFTGTVEKKVAEVQSFFQNGTTVVGINVNQIEPMKQAIRDYVKAIEDELAKLENYDPEVAFKGTGIVPALKEYIVSIEKTCQAITSNLLAFNDKLTEVQKAYQAKDDAAKSMINSTAQSTSSAYTRYNEGGQATS